MLLVRLEVDDAETSSILQRALREVEGFQIQKDPKAPADLLIHKLGREPMADFEKLQNRLNSGEVSEVFLTSKVSDPELLLKAMRAGVKECLPEPVNIDEAREALLRCKRRRALSVTGGPQKMGKIIHVIGSKGGVGSTTVAVNLAVSLMASGAVKSAALVDMHLFFGEIPIFLDARPRYHWGEIARNLHRLDEDFLMNILFKHASGVHLLAAPGTFNQQPVVSPEVIMRTLGLMRNVFDVVIVDGGHPLGNVSAALLQMTDEVVLLSILNLPCLANTTKLLETLVELGYSEVNRTHIVINRHLKKSEISIEAAEESLKRKVYWKLPNDYVTTMAAINQGTPLAQLAPNASITRGIRDLAEALMGQEEHPQEHHKKSIFKWLRKSEKPR